MTPTTAQVTLSLNAAQYFSGMSKVQAEAKTAAASIASGFTAAQGVLAGFTGVLAATGLGNIVTSTANYSKEVERLATLSNQSTREFQGMAYAASTVGIEQDKLADIFKDTQDKVGDFLQNGGGPLKDFFDNIAPRVGVTADQFRNLGGKDALQLYVSSLEKANLSQNEMTFYMEAIASDSTLLLPLLRDNGKAMSDLATEAERLGRVLDDDAIRSGKEFQENLTRLQGAADGLRLQIGNQLIPWITKLSNEFLTGIKVAGGFWEALRAFGTISPESSAAEGAKKYREELHKLTAARERLVQVEGVMANTSGFDRDIDLTRKRLSYFNELQAQQIKIDPANQTGAEARRLGLAGPSLPLLPAGGGKPAKTGGGKAGKAGKPEDPEADAERLLESLQKQLQATQNLSAEQTVLAEIEAGRLGKVSDGVRQQLIQAAQQLDTTKELIAIEKEFKDAALDTARAKARASEEQERMVKALVDATPQAALERQRREMEMLDKAFQEGRISAEQLMNVHDMWDEQSKKAKTAADDAKAFGQIMNSAFEDAIIEGGKLSDVVKGLAQDLLRLVLRKQVTEPLAKGAENWFGKVVGGLSGSGGGGTFSDFLGSLFKFEGGGWTGDGPRSGGLDGKGGFVAMLHPQERVVDTTKGQGVGGAVVINQYNTFSGSGTDKAELAMWARQVKQETLAAVQLSANRGGSFAASVGRA